MSEGIPRLFLYFLLICQQKMVGAAMGQVSVVDLFTNAYNASCDIDSQRVHVPLFGARKFECSLCALSVLAWVRGALTACTQIISRLR